jgi:hypothetical protein
LQQTAVDDGCGLRGRRKRFKPIVVDFGAATEYQHQGQNQKPKPRCYGMFHKAFQLIHEHILGGFKPFKSSNKRPMASFSIDLPSLSCIKTRAFGA